MSTPRLIKETVLLFCRIWPELPAEIQALNQGVIIMAKVLSAGQHMEYRPKFTFKGREVAIDGDPIFSLEQTDAFFRIEIDEDKRGCKVFPTELSGPCQMKCTADVRRGEQVKNLVGTDDLENLGPEADTIELGGAVVDDA